MKSTTMSTRIVLPVTVSTKPSTLFQFGNITVRTTLDDHGVPWFAAPDVCSALGLKNSRQATSKLHTDEKGVISSDTLGGGHAVSAVTEAGLYALVFRSRKPEAQEFQRWITHTVLPSIRMDGMYVLNEEKLFSSCESDADVIAQREIATAQAARLLDAKLDRYQSEHAKEKAARQDAFRLINKGRKTKAKRRPVALLEHR